MMMRRPPPVGTVVPGAGLLCLALVGPLFGQEPDTARVRADSAAAGDSALVADSALLVRPGRQRCVLRWEPLAPDTEGLSLREGGEAHVTHVSGRMLWTCGTAQMEADSAVKYDRARRVDLIGNVVYRDTTRTLRSRFLTYFELQDLVIATGDVELERVGDGSTLDGPRVEFLRAVSGVDELTIATGRPHMRLYPEGEDRTNPFEIDADRTVFAGEEEARAYGDVVITRDDLDAAADSATLRRIDETGVLWGSPWVDAQGVRLSGDTIRFASEDDELRDVHAIGSGHAVGESFEVRAEKIDVALRDREVEAVWAHGSGASEAVSGAHHVYGDSLRFVMFAGSIDTLYSVREAAAIQADGPVAMARLDEPGPAGGEGERAAVPGDSAAVAGDSAAVAGDSAAVAGDSAAVAGDSAAVAGDSATVSADTSGALPTEDSVTVETPPAFADVPAEADPAGSADDSTAVADSTAAARGPGAAAEDSMAVAEDSLPGAETAMATDSAVFAGAPAAVADSTAPAADTAGARGPPAGTETPAIRPKMSIDGRSNWVRGDTLIAIFERDSSAVSPPLGAAESVPAPGDSVTALPLPAADSIAVLPRPAEPAAATDTASEPRMRRLIAIGNASSFYRQVRDSARTSRPSRNYMIGRRIEVSFVDGEPRTVIGTAAIGIYLEPEEGASGARGEAAVDSSDVRMDSVAGPDSLSVSPDSLAPGVPPDSTAAPPDSMRVPPHSAAPEGVSPAFAPTGTGVPPHAGRRFRHFRIRRPRP